MTTINIRYSSLILIMMGGLPGWGWAAQTVDNSHSSTKKNPAPVKAEDQFLLGRAYYRGEGVPQSYEKAGEWYRRSAEGGCSKAMNNLGIMFLEGVGTPRDEKEGYSWIRKAADLDDPKSTYLAGKLLCEGRGIAKNPTEGVLLLKKASDLGNLDATTRLGQSLLFGDDGLSKDPVAASLLLRKAAMGGNRASCGLYGIILRDGIAGVTDLAGSKYWLEGGALLGDRQSVREYALLLQTESSRRAYPWLIIADQENPGDPLLQNSVIIARESLSANERAIAEKEATDILAKLPSP
jgi:hypothetical protein